MVTILFIIFMLVVIRYSNDSFGLWSFMIMAVLVQTGFLGVSLISTGIWLGLTKVASDIFYAARR
jgi:hypothetical protein